MDKKTILTLFSYAALAQPLLLLSSCTADEQDGSTSRTPIALTAAMAAEDDATTRAGTDIQSTQFAQGESFYAYFPSNVTVGSTTSASNTTFTTSNTSGATSPATTPYMNAGQSSATVHAYYPSTVTNATSSFSVQTAQNMDANYKSSDLMYATGTVTKSGSSATGSLTFTHKMAKILVTANIGAGVTNIQAIRIIGGYRTINISTPQSCTLGSTLSNANSTSSYITMYSGTSTSAVSCAALIPPQTINGNFLQIVTNAGTATYSLSSKQFETGKSYQLTITVNAAAVGTTIDITNWTGTGNVTVNPMGYLSVDAISSRTYSGYTQTPTTYVRFISGTSRTLLTKNTDYTVEYKNNINAGTAFVIITGLQGTKYENYTAIQTFTINKAAVSSSASLSLDQAKVGDIIGSDGKIYRINNNYKLPSGVLASAVVGYVGNDTGESGYTHGLAIAMRDANQGRGAAWCTNNSFYNSGQQSYSYPAVLTAKESGLTLSKMSGRDNETNYPAFYHALHNTITVEDGITSSKPTTGTTQWFLPSAFQWNQIILGLLDTNMNPPYYPNTDDNYSNKTVNIRLIGTDINCGLYTWVGGYYYTSSLIGSPCLWADGGFSYSTETNSQKVRAMLAF